METNPLGKGFVQVYTGNGKGKTTAALGLALRAAGQGLKVEIVQFLKGWPDYGELKGVGMLAPYVALHQSGRDAFVLPNAPEAEDVRLARQGWALAMEIVLGRKADVVILDEINCAVDFGLIPEQELLDLVRRKPDGMELVLTGRNARPALIAAADLVTEMREVKHYYAQGVDARAGIER